MQLRSSRSVHSTLGVEEFKAEKVARQQALPRERKEEPKEEREYCEGRAEATETVVHRDRDTARSEAKRLAKKSAKDICTAKRCPGNAPCKLIDIDEKVEVRPTQETDDPRTYTAVATVTGRCSC